MKRAALPTRAVLVRAALWLALLAPLFYLTYGYANALAARRDDVGSIVFGWEHRIPFVPWTILPYWSINLFYGLSLALNRETRGVDRLAGRYLTAQAVAVTCFLLFPLRATFVRPATDGLPGLLFAALGGFDKPFNQAPSLHIALLVIIWEHWRLRLSGAGRWLWHAWCLLIGVSVLTTWQHHFVDIPTGALLGLLALWLFPERGPLPLAGMKFSADPKRRRLAWRYGAGAGACLVLADMLGRATPAGLLLLWPALALGIVALGYAGAGPKVFQKAPDGRVSLASRLLLWPCRTGARLNAWAWTHRLPPNVAVADGVALGRHPTARQAGRFATVIDLAAELERPRAAGTDWISIPMLDLAAPGEAERRAALAAVTRALRRGPVLVCCALGFQRSAGVVADWLVASGRAASPKEAEQLIAGTGRPVRLAPLPALAVPAA